MHPPFPEFDNMTTNVVPTALLGFIWIARIAMEVERSHALHVIQLGSLLAAHVTEPGGLETLWKKRFDSSVLLNTKKFLKALVAELAT